MALWAITGNTLGKMTGFRVAAALWSFPPLPINIVEGFKLVKADFPEIISPFISKSDKRNKRETQHQPHP